MCTHAAGVMQCISVRGMEVTAVYLYLTHPRAGAAAAMARACAAAGGERARLACRCVLLVLGRGCSLRSLQAARPASTRVPPQA